MSLINKQGELSELRATMPIDILNRKVEEEEKEENELPTYENAWKSLLYSPLPYLDPTSPYSPMDEDSSYPITPLNNTNAPSGGGDYFAYQPPTSSSSANSLICGILPSYHSIMVQPDDNDDLPSYE
jgi:hypothetical protein